jgi:hypothetical protein
MDDRETREALDSVRALIAELNVALDRAATRAVDIGAYDALDRIEAAKAATARGTDCVTKLQKTLLGPEESNTNPNPALESDRLFH